MSDADSDKFDALWTLIGRKFCPNILSEIGNQPSTRKL